MKRYLLFVVFVLLLVFHVCADTARLVVISEGYNEIIWALGAQSSVVGVDLSSTYPPEIKQVPTVGYHRALSAEGILSLKPTTILHDNNIGPPQVVDQLQGLGISMKTFVAQNNSVDGAKALIREIGAFFHKEKRAEELCNTLDTQMAASLQTVKKYNDHPRVAIIHYGRASNVYLIVGQGKGTGDGSAASQMIQWAGGVMAIQKEGMQRMGSPEILAQSNPDVILLTDYGYDRLGSLDQIKTLPGIETTNAAKNNRIYRVESHELMRFGPRTGGNIRKVAAIIHKK